MAADLPTSGTFDGVYHRDRWGVGHFLCFIVHPDLHKNLAEYEGKLVRLKVTKGAQPVNPGPAILLALGEIKELPHPPLGIRVKTRPRKVTGGQPFQLVVEVTNKSKDGSLLFPVSILSTIRQPYAHSGQRPNEPSSFIKQYTVGQLSVGGRSIHMGGWETFGSPPNLKGQGGRLLLSPGASYALVASLPKGISAVDAELKIEVSYALADPKASYGVWKSHGRFEVWQDFPVQQAKPAGPTTEKQERLLAVSEVNLTDGEDGWTSLRFRLSPAKDAEKFAQIARLEGFVAGGSAVELEAVRLPERSTRDGIAQLLELPKTGVIISGRFRKQSRFAPPITRLCVLVLTDHGIETVILSDRFNDSDVPPGTPFGPQTGGVKMRIRPAKATFKEGEPLKFHLQAVNVSGKPVCWWKPSTGLGQNVVIEIDGARIKQPDRKAEYIGGWAAKWTCKNPDEWTIKLPNTLKIARGKHTLCYVIASKGGKYKNANNKLIPLFRGRIHSNEVSFSVE